MLLGLPNWLRGLAPGTGVPKPALEEPEPKGGMGKVGVFAAGEPQYMHEFAASDSDLPHELHGGRVVGCVVGLWLGEFGAPQPLQKRAARSILEPQPGVGHTGSVGG